MGYLKESIAMASRSKRCVQQWGSHFEHCQQAIQSAIELCESHHTALIFGAGSLQDIPLEHLSQCFENVILVDLLFLQSARQRVKKFSNIQLIEADITESLFAIYKGQIATTSPKRWQDCSDISFVVSLNLITQLPLLPCKWLMNHYQIDEKTVNQLSKQVIQQHLDYLKGFLGVKCLIADRWDTEFDRFGNKIDEFDPWWEITQPETVNEWDWELVPAGEGRARLGQKNRVGVSLLK